ncbi:hypothetical protein FCH28_07725 [Streptomyces piniterrae]|uniref:Uncharacterized protein n=1 Tax=Streptomyces piniterrae TaxID=2571125 RepID=A0A4U0NS83_9ACTN|nr:hypothetical protein [Streptomyces piniterrae]TJZ57310.1 hypothetical protein FCH28_07725 [Streptomyces piniterrae]
MPMPRSAPALDATVVPTGRRKLKIRLLVSLSLAALGLGAATVLLLMVFGVLEKAKGPASACALALFFGLGGVLVGLVAWQGRNIAVIIDGAGLWLDTGKARQIIPWVALAGVGMHWSDMGKGARQYSVELCPSGPIEGRDPVLWALIRDEEPIAPGLPRLRYRLTVHADHQEQIMVAIRRHAPSHLWLGVAQRERGHIGRPDLSRRPRR